jgi:hypothetical protein
MKKVNVAVILSLLFSVNASASTRHTAQANAFRKANACPVTNKIQARCPGWVVNHIEPLACGGTDVPANMEWEQRAPSYKRDAFERRVCATINQKASKK